MENVFRFRPTQHPMPFDRFEKMGSTFWNGFLITTQAVYNSTALSLIFVISGIALTVLCPPLAPPFLTMGTMLFTTTLVVKILDRYHFAIVEEFKAKACTFQTKYAKLHLISCVFAMVISLISTVAGTLAGGMIGIISGLVMQDERLRRLRKIHAENIKNSKPKVEEKMGFV
ncbi:hypothetical protein PARA125_001389 [Parachlamydia sp. AcF125]|nr:hypothetical protein [Parachlamydia sp. AcF125]